MGRKIGYVMCGDCKLHMSYCNCEGGIKAPKEIIKPLDRLIKIE
jgi:hypothetical protein